MEWSEHEIDKDREREKGCERKIIRTIKEPNGQSERRSRQIGLANRVSEWSEMGEEGRGA